MSSSRRTAGARGTRRRRRRSEPVHASPPLRPLARRRQRALRRESVTSPPGARRVRGVHYVEYRESG
eukprot:1853176-Prymnesium_polylepis.1